MPKIVSQKSLEAELARLQKRIRKAQLARQKVVRSIAKQIENHGISLSELRQAMNGRSVKTRRQSKVAVKYRDDQGNSWTGRGRPPRWLVAAEKAGKKRQHFAV